MYWNFVANTIHFFPAKKIYIRKRASRQDQVVIQRERKRINGGDIDTEFDMASFFFCIFYLFMCDLLSLDYFISYTVNNIVRVKRVSEKACRV
jgi:hypothetical protein